MEKMDVLTCLTSQVTLFCVFYAKTARGKLMVLLLYTDHFFKYYWTVYEQDDKPNKLLKQRYGEEELIAEEKMKEKKKQAQLIGYSPSTEKNKKYPTMEDGSVALAAGGALSAVDKAVIRSIAGLQDNFACAGQSNSKIGKHDSFLVTACVGAFNSFNGKNKNNIALVHNYVLIDQTKSKYQQGLYFSRPAIVSK
jgi:hypothetical protein